MRPRSAANSGNVLLPLVRSWSAPCWMRSSFSVGKDRDIVEHCSQEDKLLRWELRTFVQVDEESQSLEKAHNLPKDRL